MILAFAAGVARELVAAVCALADECRAHPPGSRLSPVSVVLAKDKLHEGERQGIEPLRYSIPRESLAALVIGGSADAQLLDRMIE